MRVLARLLKKAQKLVPMSVPDHSRRVLYRTTALRSQRLEPAQRQGLYFDLLQDTKGYIEAALFAAQFLEACDGPQPYVLSLQLRTQAENALCIVDQTERRVLKHQQVPALAKRVSLFEAHADILCKRDEVVYGHKVSLSFGKTGVVLAAEVLQGNPADATLTVPALQQVKPIRARRRTTQRWTRALRPKPMSRRSRKWGCSGSPSTKARESTARRPAATGESDESCIDFEPESKG